MTQAVALNQILRRNGHQVVSVLVGKHQHRCLPEFFQNSFDAHIIPIRSPGFTFVSGKGVALLSTTKNILKSLGVYRQSLEILHETIRKTKPDLIINFLEPMTGIYNLLHGQSVPTLSIGHQFMMEHPKAFAFGRMRFQQLLMRLYVRLTGARSTRVALSQKKEDDLPGKKLFVCPPLLRSQLFDLKSDPSGEFLLIYLVNPGYAEDIIRWHQAHPHVQIHCFYDKSEAPAESKHDDALTFHAVDGEKFLAYMAKCRAVACTAGFESVCEAVYLRKPVLLIPVANHVEQNMNALEAEARGYGLSDTQFNLERIVNYQGDSSACDLFKAWVDSAEATFLRVLSQFDPKNKKGLKISENFGLRAQL